MHIGVTRQIGFYSDAIEVAPHLRWLMTLGTPGFSEGTKMPADIMGQSELAWENVLRVLSKADMAIEDIVKVTQYLTRAEDVKAYARLCKASFHVARHPQLVWPTCLSKSR